MSFPYGQYPSENYSTPSTPLDAFPQWETLERDEQRSHSEQQSQQDTAQQQLAQQHQQPPELHLQTTPPPPPHQHYQTIRLEEPVPLVPSQQRPAHDNLPVRLHHVHRPERRRESPGGHESSLPRIDTRSSSTSGGPVRQSSRSHQQQQAHPYLRPSTSSNAPMTRQQHVRFANTQASAPSSAMPSPSLPSPAIPSPASATSRLVGFGSTVSSPLVNLDISLPPSLSRQDQNLPRKRFIIRTDSNYDPESKVLTAMLELPGVKKVDVRVTLSTCHYNGVRQITVSGHTDPVFAAPSAGGPGGDLTVRERKFGEFIRTFAVPAGIKREDIDASMEDGILTLKIPCGPPASLDAEDVSIR